MTLIRSAPAPYIDRADPVVRDRRTSLPECMACLTVLSICQDICSRFHLPKVTGRASHNHASHLSTPPQQT